MQDLTTYLLWGPTSSLTHCPVSGSDTICNNPSPLLAYIVCFGPLRIAVSLTVSKCVYWRKVSTPYKKCFIPFSNRGGIYVKIWALFVALPSGKEYNIACFVTILILYLESKQAAVITQLGSCCYFVFLV